MAIFAGISYVATSNGSIALVLILVLVNTTYLTFLLDGQFILDFQNDNQVPPQAGAYIKVSLALYIFAYSKPSLALLIIAVCFLTFFLFYFHYLGNLSYLNLGNILTKLIRQRKKYLQVSLPIHDG